MTLKLALALAGGYGELGFGTRPLVQLDRVEQGELRKFRLLVNDDLLTQLELAPGDHVTVEFAEAFSPDR